ncbi:hypothetical protein [Streptomyces sp. NPDC002537]
MVDNNETPDEPLDVFARYKAHYEGERDLKPKMREMAARQLQAGMSVGQLAKLTGLTPEVFRRMARDLGIERKRPPTVGRLATRERPAPEQTPQHWEGSPSNSKRTTAPEPPPSLGLSPGVVALSEDKVRLLAGQAEAQHPDWGREIRRELCDVPTRWMRHAVVEAALQAGYVDVAGDRRREQ